MQRLFGQNQLVLPGLPQSVKLALMADESARPSSSGRCRTPEPPGQGAPADDGGAEDSGQGSGRSNYGSNDNSYR